MPRCFAQRMALSAALALSLSACAQVHIAQDPHQAIQRTSGEDDFAAFPASGGHAGPVAARVLPYALLAEQSYEPKVYLTHRAAPQARHCVDDNYTDCVTGAEDKPRADAWLAQWRLVFACDGARDCKTAAKGRDDVSGGLGVQIWARRGAVCPEAAIVFRGTVGGDRGDWESNFHWLLRATHVYDQYDQVSDHIADFVAVLKRDACYRSSTQILAIGHSLGGGLAQLAAYANADIDRIYAFDPSMVTGFYSVNPKGRDDNVKGLVGERVFEHGELLAYARYVMRQFVPPSPCDPRMVNIRFDVLHGSPIDQHSLSDFTSALLREARNSKPQSNPMVLEKCAGKARAAS